jgi:hypothetical protein
LPERWRSCNADCCASATHNQLPRWLITTCSGNAALSDPAAADRELLDKAARTAFKMSKVIITSLLALEAGGTYYPAQPWINTMDKPTANADGSHDIYFGPGKPASADDSNWLRTVPGKDAM